MPDIAVVRLVHCCIAKLHQLLFQTSRMVEVSLLLALAPWLVAAVTEAPHQHLPAYGRAPVAPSVEDCGMEGGVWVAGLAAILVFYLLVVIVGAIATIAQKSKTGKGGATQDQVRWGGGVRCTRCGVLTRGGQITFLRLKSNLKSNHAIFGQITKSNHKIK